MKDVPIKIELKTEHILELLKGKRLEHAFHDGKETVTRVIIRPSDYEIRMSWEEYDQVLRSARAAGAHELFDLIKGIENKNQSNL